MNDFLHNLQHGPETTIIGNPVLFTVFLSVIPKKGQIKGLDIRSVRHPDFRHPVCRTVLPRLNLHKQWFNGSYRTLKLLPLLR